MFNKSLLIGLTIASLSTAAIADESHKIMLNEQNVTIYENFALQDKVENNKNVTNSADTVNSEVIADIGEFQAIKANGNDGSNIALVVANDKNLRTYAITSEIHYICNGNADYCVPDGIEAEQIGDSNIYKVTVSNFSEWQAVVKILENTSSVKKVFPGYNYGDKNIIN